MSASDCVLAGSNIGASVHSSNFFSSGVYPFSKIRIQDQNQVQILFMKSTAFEIQIPSKCTVSESNFRPHEKGDWCLSCRKTVVDFMEMSDASYHRVLTWQKIKNFLNIEPPRYGR
jgi:hypothetical protein